MKVSAGQDCNMVTKLGVTLVLLQIILLFPASSMKPVFISAYNAPTARIVWEYPTTPYFYSHACGDADRLPNGNTLITVTQEKTFIETTMNGEVVWDVNFEWTSPSMRHVQMGLYRSLRVPNLDLSSSVLYNPHGYDPPFKVNVIVWNQQKACKGITFFMLGGDVWGMNMKGALVWKYEGVFSLQKLLPNNHLLLAHTDTKNGVIREIDLNGNIIFNIVTNVHHDAIKLNEYNILYLSKVYKEVNGIEYKGDEIRQMDIRTQEIVWSWNTFDYLSMNDNCSICMSLHRDWTHSNALTAALEGNRYVVYLDVRNLNQIIKIDYETKQIIWKLGENGDFQMFEMNGTAVAKLFSHQHDPELQPNGNILLFDNGYHWDEEHKPFSRPSRAIEIQLTDQNAPSKIF